MLARWCVHGGVGAVGRATQRCMYRCGAHTAAHTPLRSTHHCRTHTAACTAAEFALLRYTHCCGVCTAVHVQLCVLRSGAAAAVRAPQRILSRSIVCTTAVLVPQQCMRRSGTYAAAGTCAAAVHVLQQCARRSSACVYAFVAVCVLQWCMHSSGAYAAAHAGQDAR